MGLILFGLYSAAVLAASLAARRRQGGRAGFYLHNRSAGAWAVGASLVVSCVGASATVGTVGLAYAVGTPAFWWLGSGALGLSVLTVFLAVRVRRSRARTMPEIVEGFFGPDLRRLISLIIVLAWLSILAAQFSALGQVVAALTGLEAGTALGLGAGLVLLPTLIGGQAGVIGLDRWQCLILLIGLGLLTGWLFGLNGQALAGVRLEAVNADFPAERLIYFLLILGGSYVVCPTLFGRLLSAESETAARRGAWGAVLGLAGASVLVVLIGLLSRGLVAPGLEGDAVLARLLETALPAWLALAAQVTLLSAIVSSADSGLLTAGLVLAHDVLGRRDLRSARLALAALVLGGLLLTLSGRGILGFLLMANDIYVCGVVGPVFVGLMRADGRAPSRPLAAAAIALGGLLGLTSALTGQIYFSYAGLAASVLLTLLSLRAGPAPAAVPGRAAVK